jgi:Flp pilus assembly protein TadG
MLRRSGKREGERGQALVLFALSAMLVLIPVVALVVDGGYALVQRRASQNASDFAALAGARVVAQWVSGDTTHGTDANVQATITNYVTLNGGAAVTFGSPSGPAYVNASGAQIGFVGSVSGTIPAGAVGVRVASTRSWSPFFLRIVGIDQWSASAEATARGGYAAGGPPGGVFPAGISQAFFQTYPFCAGAISALPADPCYPKHLTPGNLNVPGGFGWLKFGCAGYGLGQGNDGGCDNSAGFLQSEIGPPSNSHGCCTAVNLPGSLDQIGSLPGNKASADCSYWINSGATVTVPIWDTAGGNGSNGWYHIVGFAGFQITGCSGGKNIEGVWREQFFLGPTTSTSPGVTGSALAVQLVR